MKHRMLATCLAVAIATAVHGPAHADLAAAVAAYDAKDFAAAAAEFQQLGRSGDAEAQYRLGLMHERGEGVAANDTTAWSWFKRAGDGNHVAAQMKVADSYASGRGVPMSLAEAYKWYKRAADRGDARAKAKVGLMNVFGQGKKPDHLEGLRWLKEAALAGDAEAQAVLDGLAAQGFETETVEGETEPADPRARRLLEEVRGLIQPLQNSSGDWRLITSGEVRVAAKGDGYVVIIPRARLEGRQATLRLGTIRLGFVPEGEELYRVEATLPARIALMDDRGAEAGAVTFASQRFAGHWSTRWHALVDYEAEYSGLRMLLANGAVNVAVDRLNGRRSAAERAGRHDLTDLFEIAGIRLQGGPVGQSVTAAMSSLAIRNEYRGLDLDGARNLGAQVGVDWRTGTVDASRMAAALKAGKVLPGIIEGVSSRVVVGDCTLSGADGVALGGLGQAELRFAADNLSAPLAKLTFGYSWDGLKVAEETGVQGALGALPAAGVLAVAVDRFPTQELLRAVLGVLADGDAMAGSTRKVDPRQMELIAARTLDRGMNALRSAFLAAKTEVRIEEMSVTAADYDVFAKGAFTPSPTGWGGAVDLRVRDLGKLLAMADASAGALADATMPGGLAGMAQYGREQSDAQGRKVTTFDLRFEPSGRLLVNGSDPKQASSGRRKGG